MQITNVRVMQTYWLRNHQPIRFTGIKGRTLLNASAASMAVAGSFVLGYWHGRQDDPKQSATPVSLNAPLKTTPSETLDSVLFPPIKPFKTQMLPVSKRHTIYVEESGNPNGYPVIFLHGGPGAGLSENYRRFFDPAFFHIIGFEQRGCGRSLPLGDLEENTTWDLVEDIQRIRQALHVDQKKYLLFGGSWGSLLGLAAAEKHPENVAGLILRGLSLGRPEDTAWSTEVGRGILCKYPEAGDYLATFLKTHPFHEDDIRMGRDPMLGVFDRLFNDPTVSETERLTAVKYWNLCATYQPGEDLARQDAENPPSAYADDLPSARLVCRYYYMNGYMNPADQLLRDIKKLRTIGHIAVINGREDENTPAIRAWEVHKALDRQGIRHSFQILEGTGHSAWQLPMTKALFNSVKAFQESVSADTRPDFQSISVPKLTFPLRQPGNPFQRS